MQNSKFKIQNSRAKRQDPKKPKGKIKESEQKDQRDKIRGPKIEKYNPKIENQKPKIENHNLKIENGSGCSHLVAFRLHPLDRPADDEVVVKGCGHNGNPELAVSEIHHDGKQNINGGIFPALTRKCNHELKNECGIGEDPDQTVRAGHVDVHQSGEAENKEAVGNDHRQEEEIIQQMRGEDFKGDAAVLSAEQS